VNKWQKSGMLAVIMACAIAAPAQADEGEFTGETVAVQSTPQTRETCTDPQVAPLLQSFKDRELYFVAPGGDFEDGAAGWQLEGGARIAGGSSAFAPLGSGQHSLQLRAGAAATSPAFCVDERFPTFRVTVGQLGVRKAKVRVSVVYPGLAKNVRKEADVDADEKTRWELSKRMKLQPTHGQKRGGWRLVALRFEVLKEEAGADARIDDVLVDPRMRY
jgi:hypothetical protein